MQTSLHHFDHQAPELKPVCISLSSLVNVFAGLPPPTPNVYSFHNIYSNFGLQQSSTFSLVPVELIFFQMWFFIMSNSVCSTSFCFQCTSNWLRIVCISELCLLLLMLRSVTVSYWVSTSTAGPDSTSITKLSIKSWSSWPQTISPTFFTCLGSGFRVWICLYWLWTLLRISWSKCCEYIVTVPESEYSSSG